MDEELSPKKKLASDFYHATIYIKKKGGGSGGIPDSLWNFSSLKQGFPSWALLSSPLIATKWETK